MTARMLASLGACGRKLAAAIGILLALAGAASPARCADEYDFAVEAFSEVSSNAAGITISDDEKRFLTPFVRCLGKGQGNVGDCAATAILNQVPAEAQAFMKCMVLDGRPLPACAVEGVISQLPQDARDAIKCLRTSVVECGISKLPPGTQDLARCLAHANDPKTCGKEYVETQAEKAALAAASTVSSDLHSFGGEIKGPIRNVIDVAIGIANKDWPKVIASGGEAVAKVAAHIILVVVLTPAGADALGPAVDYAVSKDAELIQRIIDAARSGDPGALAQILTEYYLGYAAGYVCTVINGDVPITGDIKEAICGEVGKAIALAGDIARGAVDTVADVIHLREVLHLFGEAADREKDILSHAFAGKDFDCEAPETYYAKHFMRCYTRAAYLINYQPGQAGDLFNRLMGKEGYDQGCEQYYIKCVHQSERNEICTAMQTRYQTDTAVLAQAVKDAANVVVTLYRKVQPRSSGCQTMDDAEELSLESKCVEELRKTFPVTGDAETADCSPPAQPRFGGVITYETPCHDVALAEQKRRLAICKAGLDVASKPAIPGLTCASNMTMQPDGRCSCTMAERWDGRRCLPSRRNAEVGTTRGITCMSNMSMQSNGKCGCSMAEIWNGTRCVLSPNKVKSWPVETKNGGTNYLTDLRRCVPPRPVGTYPNCCPNGTFYAAGVCRFRSVTVGPTVTPRPPQGPLMKQYGGGVSPAARWSVRNSPTVKTRVAPKKAAAGKPTTKMCYGRRIPVWSLCAQRTKTAGPAKHRAVGGGKYKTVGGGSHLHAIGKSKKASSGSGASGGDETINYGGCGGCGRPKNDGLH